MVLKHFFYYLIIKYALSNWNILILKLLAMEFSVNNPMKLAIKIIKDLNLLSPQIQMLSDNFLSHVDNNNEHYITREWKLMKMVGKYYDEPVLLWPRSGTKEQLWYSGLLCSSEKNWHSKIFLILNSVRILQINTRLS